MAQEITANVGLQAKKGSLSIGVPSATQRIDLSGTHFAAGVQDIGTAYEQVVTASDMATAGWAYFANLDASNYVEIGLEVSAAFYPLVKLLPGEACTFPLATLTFFARANTATVKMSKMILER